MLKFHSETDSHRANLLSILIRLRKIGTGFPSLIMMKNICMWITSYFSSRWLGGSAVTSTVCRKILDGCHSCGEQDWKLISSPSSSVVVGRACDAFSNHKLRITINTIYSRPRLSYLPCPYTNFSNFEVLHIGRNSWMQKIAKHVLPNIVNKVEPSTEG